MKQGFLLILLFSFITSTAQTKPFRFAFISDTHIGSPNGGAEEDLRRTVADINSMKNVAFVVITGDITELGTNAEIKLAKQILDSLNVPYYIIPGNHDTGWSESGGLTFTKIFGDDKFHFNYNGIHFLGCASGPYVRMSDGHIPRNAVNWLSNELKKIALEEPVIFLNHYPLDNGLDNWYEAIDLLKQKNTVLALCGHGHNNRLVQAEDIPAVMGRSNLRAKAAEGGYNIVDVRADSFLFTERKPLSKTENLWTKVQLKKQQYDLTKKFTRPTFSVNQQYPQVSAGWMYNSTANIISTPAVANDLVVFGNQNGLVEALSLKDGKRKWRFQTSGPIFSSPAFSSGNVVLGSADGFIYCLSDKGKMQWKLKTGASVLGSPLIENGTVFIGGSDSCFQAIDFATGKPVWRFCGLSGPVTSKPVMYKEMIIFGAWDRNLYALNKLNGELLWKWNNGSTVINYSPAACIPVVHDDVVYIVAPDRFLSAIDIRNGHTLWRTNQSTVRESIGISEDGKIIYGKTMQDTIVAFNTNKEKPDVAWKFFAGFGYEHTPSMLIEKNGSLFFGTRNSVIYALSLMPNPHINWAYKIDNSMVNTINVLDDMNIIAATMDGKVALIKVAKPGTPINLQKQKKQSTQ